MRSWQSARRRFKHSRVRRSKSIVIFRFTLFIFGIEEKTEACQKLREVVENIEKLNGDVDSLQTQLQFSAGTSISYHYDRQNRQIGERAKYLVCSVIQIEEATDAKEQAVNECRAEQEKVAQARTAFEGEKDLAMTDVATLKCEEPNM